MQKKQKQQNLMGLTRREDARRIEANHALDAIFREECQQSIGNANTHPS